MIVQNVSKDSKTDISFTSPSEQKNDVETILDNYIKRLEELIECPIKIISTSPDRKDTIILENLFN